MSEAYQAWYKIHDDCRHMCDPQYVSIEIVATYSINHPNDVVLFLFWFCRACTMIHQIHNNVDIALQRIK